MKRANEPDSWVPRAARLRLESRTQARVVGVATSLLGRSGVQDTGIYYTELGPGVRTGEGLFSSSEDRRATSNQVMAGVDVAALSVGHVHTLHLGLGDHKTAAEWMRNQSQQLPSGA